MRIKKKKTEEAGNLFVERKRARKGEGAKMNSKVNSLEEKVKLPPTETISRCYQPQQSNRKVIRILTVAVYVLCVSLAAIMLSLYYIFIWDPTIRPFVTKANQCGKS